MNSHPTDVRDPAECIEEAFQTAIGKQEGIAATEDDFVQGLVRADGSQRRLPGS
jgi:hypothetical protein